MDPVMIGTLMLIGAVTVVAAVAGGNLTLPGGTQFAALSSTWVRWILALAGTFFFVIGLSLAATHLEDSTSGGNSPASTSGASSADERREYLDVVAPICIEMRNALAAIGEPAIRQPQDVGRVYAEGGDVLQRYSQQMKQVVPPNADRTVLSTLYDRLDAFAISYQKLASSFFAGDEEAATEDAQEAEAAKDAYAAAARDYGLRAPCIV